MADQRKVPDLLLEQHALGELPEQTADGVVIGPDEEARLEALRTSDADILAAHPPAQVAAAISARLDRATGPAASRSALTWGLAGAAAAALVALLAWFVWPARQPEPARDRLGLDTPGTERVKIDHGLLQIHRQRGAASEPLGSGDLARPGDRLQLRYNAMGERHGVIFSVDGRGAVTLHLPETEDGSTALAGRGVHDLPHSYELDDAPAFERFFFVTGDGPIDVRAVTAAARGIGPTSALALPANLRQTDFLLRKPAPRIDRRTP